MSRAVRRLSIASLSLVAAGLLACLPRKVAEPVRPPDLLEFSAEPAAQRDEFAQALAERLQALPGVRSAGWSLGSLTKVQVIPEGNPVEQSAVLRLIGQGYFKTLGIPLLRGRALTPGDAQRPTAGVISETAARRCFPDADPIGRRLRLGESQVDIVGVAGDEVQGEAAVYLPFQMGGTGPIRFSIHTVGDAGALRPAVRAVAETLDPAVPLSDFKTRSR